MIVVTGATGHLGRLVIAALLKKVPASGRPTTSLAAAVAAALGKLGKWPVPCLFSTHFHIHAVIAFISWPEAKAS